MPQIHGVNSQRHPGDAQRSRRSSQAPVVAWGEMRVPLSPAKILGAVNVPTFSQLTDDGAGSVGVYAWYFADDDQIFFETQLPHDWKVGSAIFPHLHWCPTSVVEPTDNIGIGLEYAWWEWGEAIGNSTLLEVEATTGIVSHVQRITDLSAAGIEAAGKTISSLFVGRVYRLAADTDNYADPVAFVSFDIHYEVDGFGSQEQYYK